MAFENCIAEIRAAAGDAIDEPEAKRILQQAFDRASRYEKDGMAKADATLRAARELGEEERVRAAVEKRNLLINIKVRRNLNAGVVEGKEAQSVRAALAGVEGNERGWGHSADARAHEKSAELMGGVIGELRQAGLLEALKRRNRDLDLDIWKEMWRLTEPDKWPGTGNRIAEQAAAILGKWNELSRQQLNDAGAFIRRLENYVTRQTHDQWKIRGKFTAADFKAWRDDIVGKLDERSFEGVEDHDKFLSDIWKALSSGLHDSSNGADWLGAFKGPHNLGKSLSHERVLHFKDAQSAWDYNQRWGKDASIFELSLYHLQHAGRNIELMRTFGPNPEAMFDDWVETLAREARDRHDGNEDLRLLTLRNHRLLDAVTGRGAIPDHMGLAQIAQGVRNAQSMAKLGGVVLSSSGDIATSAATLRWSGVPFFQRWGELIATPFSHGRRSGGERRVADELGVGIDTLRGQVLSRIYSADGVPGVMSRMVNVFHRVNLLGYWTDSFKTTIASLAGRNLARVVGREFDQLDSHLQITLRRFGIEEAEWNALRRAEIRAEDGHDYLMPGSMLSLPDEAIAHLLPEKATPRQFAEMRETLRSKLGTYISEQTREGMTEPSAADRMVATLGTKPGTWEGEAWRTLFQFKQFPITMVRRSLNREFYRKGTPDVSGIVQLAVSTTLLGYAAMTLKELAKGRDPRQPQSTQDYIKTVGAAIAQGGGLGIFGDFLFGQYSRIGGGLAGTVLGPTFGMTDELYQMYATIRDGSTTKTRGQALGAEGVRFLANHAPFINLFYTRLALDYLFLYQLQEAVNPGFLRRYENKIKRDNAQQFWLPPTQAVRF